MLFHRIGGGCVIVGLTSTSARCLKIIEHCERSELRLHLESVIIGQKLGENAKIKKVKCDIVGDFQTLCSGEQFSFCSVEEAITTVSSSDRLYCHPKTLNVCAAASCRC